MIWPKPVSPHPQETADEKPHSRAPGQPLVASLLAAFGLLAALYGSCVASGVLPFNSGVWVVGEEVALRGPLAYLLSAIVHLAAACRIVASSEVGSLAGSLPACLRTFAGGARNLRRRGGPENCGHRPVGRIDYAAHGRTLPVVEPELIPGPTGNVQPGLNSFQDCFSFDNSSRQMSERCSQTISSSPSGESANTCVARPSRTALSNFLSSTFCSMLLACQQN